MTELGQLNKVVNRPKVVLRNILQKSCRVMQFNTFVRVLILARIDPNTKVAFLGISGPDGNVSFVNFQ